MSLRDAGFAWATAQSPMAPVISCWDDNNDTQVVDTHEYSIPNDRSPVFSDPKKGGIVTEAGARFFQHTHDYGSPLAWVHWLNSIRNGVSTAPFAPGVMLSWEVMVGHTNTRWHWTSAKGDPEPAVPWCGFIYPDGTPVSYTEAAAIRAYTTGRSDFLFFATGYDSTPQKGIVVNSSGWTGWAGNTGTISTGTLYELSLWPDSTSGNVTVSIGGFDVTIDAVPLPFSCKITKELGCFLDQMHDRLLPVPVGGSGAMTHEMCAAFAAFHNITGDGAVYGVEDGEQCWAGKMSTNAQKLNESDCEAIPCGGDPNQACGGPYKIQAFTAACEAEAEEPVMITATLPGRAQALGTVDVRSRLVQGAWNILRVLVKEDRLVLWCNPNFADVTGASVPPTDERRAPHPPKPLIDLRLVAPVKSRRALSARATGEWRIDYASVLPGLGKPSPTPSTTPSPPPPTHSPTPPAFHPKFDLTSP